MLLIRLLGISFLFTVGCQNIKDKEINNKITKIDTSNEVKEVSHVADSSLYMEVIASAFFSKKFDEVKSDLQFSKVFKIVKEVEESEDVQWDSYNFYNNGKIIIKVENNWEDKKSVSRITFYDDYYHTRNNISSKSHFKDIRSLIDTNKLNNSSDGSLLFFDRKIKNLAYFLELDPNSQLYNGVISVKKIPNDLQLTSIIFFR